MICVVLVFGFKIGSFCYIKEIFGFCCPFCLSGPQPLDFFDLIEYFDHVNVIFTLIDFPQRSPSYCKRENHQDTLSNPDAPLLGHDLAPSEVGTSSLFARISSYFVSARGGNALKSLILFFLWLAISNFHALA